MKKKSATGRMYPWHFWVVNIVAVFFMFFGVYDFIMVVTQNQAYLTSMYTPAGVAYFTNYPLALFVLFGLSTVGTLFAVVASFWSKHLAMQLALIAGSADVVLLLVTVLLRNRLEAIGIAQTVQDMLICVGIFALVLYYWWLSKRERASI